MEPTNNQDQTQSTDDIVMPQEETPSQPAESTTPSLEEFLAGEAPTEETAGVPAGVEEVPISTGMPTETAVPAKTSVDEGEIQSLANEVAQALVELEKLKDEKDDLEKQLNELQTRHKVLDEEITTHKQVVTELLEKVQKVIS